MPTVELDMKMNMKMRMNRRTRGVRRAVLAIVVCTVASAGGAAPPRHGATPFPQAPDSSAAAENTAGTALRLVNEAVVAVRALEAEPRMRQRLRTAKGIFLIPNYARAAVGVGASAGTGILLVRLPDGTWSQPAFYRTGGLSIGAQLGAEGGPLAMLLNNDKAVSKFRQNNMFSLSADAGLTVLNWAKLAQSAVGEGDVIAWAGTSGLYGNVATVGLNGIRFNPTLTNAYYQGGITVDDALSGRVPDPHGNSLKNALWELAQERP